MNNAAIIDKLRHDIMRLEGFRRQPGHVLHIDGLQLLESAFPNGVFPKGVVHEFLTFKPECVAATAGFIAGILSKLMNNNGVCLWISTRRKIFPRAFSLFNVQPDNVIFIQVQSGKHVLWATEEALKCKAVAGVIAEVTELTFMQSRRLQLVVEKSNVTGLVLRTDARKLCTTACAARWEIKPVASYAADGLPGVGFPRWNVELLKVRNGKTGSWIIEWRNGNYTVVGQPAQTETGLIKQAG